MITCIVILLWNHWANLELAVIKKAVFCLCERGVDRDDMRRHGHGGARRRVNDFELQNSTLKLIQGKTQVCRSQFREPLSLSDFKFHTNQQAAARKGSCCHPRKILGPPASGIKAAGCQQDLGGSSLAYRIMSGNCRSPASGERLCILPLSIVLPVCLPVRSKVKLRRWETRVACVYICKTLS